MSDSRTTSVLLILDGWGYREETAHNAIHAAHTPYWDRLWQDNPHTLIHTSGMAVGLPEGQMGNSEVGHMNLGAGRIVYQNFTRITKAIEDGEFFHNPALTAAIDKAVNAGKAVHIMGLLSPGGVHSHEDHIQAACAMAVQRGAQQLYVHGFLDGRDTPPKSAQPSLERLDGKLAELGVGRIASLSGRYFAMDRDNRWDRVEAAYNLMTQGQGDFSATDAVSALQAAYERGETDEFVKPTAIVDAEGDTATINDGDVVLFMNFRADRARQITRAFVNADFTAFARAKTPQLADFVMLTEYAADIDTACAFPPEDLHNDIGQYLAGLNKTQLRIAETEKYAHVTFFFSGGREDTYPGETRELIPSPDVATYDLKPEMSAPEVTEKLVAAIKSGAYDLIVCNFANGDMVGHTGNYNAAVKAAEAIDQALAAVCDAVLAANGHCLITADHGNAELMVDETSGQPHTAHTSGPVPLVYVGKRALKLEEGGRLADVSPTLLDLMALDQPAEMSGHSLLQPA